MRQHFGLNFDSDFLKLYQQLTLRSEPNQDGGAKPDPTIANNIVFDSFGMYQKMITHDNSFFICQDIVILVSMFALWCVLWKCPCCDFHFPLFLS